MRLNQVTVPARDIAEAIAFYTSLGLQLIVEDKHYARFVVPDGEATFSVHHVDRPPSSPGIVVYFECRDLDRKVRELQAGGVVFLSAPADQPWLWREARLRDPSGNELCLYRAGENRLNPPWRIAPR